MRTTGNWPQPADLKQRSRFQENSEMTERVEYDLSEIAGLENQQIQNNKVHRVICKLSSLSLSRAMDGWVEHVGHVHTMRHKGKRLIARLRQRLVALVFFHSTP